MKVREDTLKMKKILFKLKGKLLGYSPCLDYEKYKKYILKEK